MGQPLWSRSLVYPGPPEGGESCHSWIEQGRRSPGPFQRGHGEWDVVSHEVTRGSGRTRGARSPLCTRRGSGLAAARCSPPGTSAHLREGLTWAGRPSSSRAGPSPRPPALPSWRTPALTCTARLGHVPGGGLPLCCPVPRGSRARPRSQAASGPSGLRAPRPAPPPRALGCRHRSRRRLAAPSRSLKGAERRPRRPPRRRGGTDGGRRPTRPRGPALRPDREPARLRPARPLQRAGGDDDRDPAGRRDHSRDTRHCSPDRDVNADWESGARGR